MRDLDLPVSKKTLSEASAERAAVTVAAVTVAHAPHARRAPHRSSAATPPNTILTMAPEAVNKSPVGIVADLPAQKKKPSEIRAEKNQATREEGNALFKAGNVTAAAAKYTECIDSDSQDALSLANRAECYLRARQFTLALRDADAARAADPSKPKALYKRAMALNGLGRYPDAVKTLKELLAVEPEDAAATNALAECEMLTRQAFLGDYDMPALLFGRLAMSFRRCADYVGPVAVARVPGKGRGVVVTKDVKAGDLLCVSSPLAVAPLRAGAEMALVQGLVAAAARAGGHEARRGSARLERRVGGRRLRAPSRPRAVPQAPRGATSRSRTPRRRRRPSPGTAPRWSRRRRSETPARWACTRSPAFINHGCAPNACKVVIGHTVFLRAARDMREGEEVLMKYFEVTAPEPERAAQAKRFGIEKCACRRCETEREGEAEARAASAAAAAAAKRAREAAVADPANKKPGMDRDGEKAARARRTGDGRPRGDVPGDARRGGAARRRRRTAKSPPRSPSGSAPRARAARRTRRTRSWSWRRGSTRKRRRLGWTPRARRGRARPCCRCTPTSRTA